MNTSKLKTFKYKIADTDIFKPIQVEISKCQSIKDLKKKIAIDLHIFDYKLCFINPPIETQLKKIKEYYTFNLTVGDCCKNIDFVFPKKEIIQITNCYKMNYHQIVKSFQSKGLYFSNECIKKYFHFKISGKELPHIEYPLLGIPYEQHLVNVEFGCTLVNLKYGQNQFLFAENEHASEAYNLITDTYKGCSYVSIQNNKKQIINHSDKLKKFIKYIVHVEYRISFKNIKSDFESIFYLDSLSRVYEAKKYLAIICSSNRQLCPESILIYDENKEIIEDPRKTFKSIQDLDKSFYYDISKKRKFLNPTVNQSKSSRASPTMSPIHNSPGNTSKTSNKQFDLQFDHQPQTASEIVFESDFSPKQSKKLSYMSYENTYNDYETAISDEDERPFSSEQVNFEEEEEIDDYYQNIKSKKIKYYFQTCRENTVDEIELSPDATVLAFKKFIAEKNDVDNLENVKVIFNGNELLDDSLLISLRISDSKIFVYIRSKEDIITMKENDLPLLNETSAVFEEEEEM